MIGLLLEALGESAERDQWTGREVYPLWVFHVLGWAAAFAVFGAWASVG